jgi:hypothetical protein
VQLTPKKKLFIFLGLVLLLHLLATGYGLSRSKQGPGGGLGDMGDPNEDNFDQFKEELTQTLMDALPSFLRDSAETSGDLPDCIDQPLAKSLQAVDEEGLVIQRFTWRPPDPDQSNNEPIYNTPQVIDGIRINAEHVGLVLNPPPGQQTTAELRQEPPLFAAWYDALDSEAQAAIAQLNHFQCHEWSHQTVPHVDDAPPLEQGDD